MASAIAPQVRNWLTTLSGAVMIDDRPPARHAIRVSHRMRQVFHQEARVDDRFCLNLTIT